MIVSALNWW